VVHPLRNTVIAAKQIVMAFVEFNVPVTVRVRFRVRRVRVRESELWSKLGLEFRFES
jgi:hypothetical protein